MTKVKLSKGESLVKLLSKAGIIVDSFTGIWLVEKGSLQKIAIKEDSDQKDDYSVLNLYPRGDYLMGDSDLSIDYVALEDSEVSQVSIVDIDPIQVLYQLDSLEELLFVNSYKLSDGLSGRFCKFLHWAGKKLGKKEDKIPEVLTQSEMGKLIGVNRITINRKLQNIKRLGKSIISNL